MKLACQEQLIPGTALEEKWELIAAAGFDGIELLGRGDFAFERRLDELRAARRAGVVISSVCVAMDHFIGDLDSARRRDAIENMKSLLSVIAEVGGVGAVTPASFGVSTNALPPWEPSPRTPDEDRAVLIEGVTELAEHALPLDVAVLFEPLNRYEDHMVNRVSQAADICRAVGSTAAKVMADAFHMNIEEKDLGAAVQENAEAIGHIHVADSGRLQPGVGHLDWPGLLGALRDINYQGWLAMECGIEGDPEDALPRVASLLRPLM
ncbi:MAG TPA: sugar phosphate isomerase/epimerase family protein [Actinomycetota bacterium]|nr:sugar phosphate isomerase/epimerase family protein [Actinomycetota bacterium]